MGGAVAGVEVETEADLCSGPLGAGGRVAQGLLQSEIGRAGEEVGADLGIVVDRVPGGVRWPRRHSGGVELGALRRKVSVLIDEGGRRTPR